MCGGGHYFQHLWFYCFYGSVLDSYQENLVALDSDLCPSCQKTADYSCILLYHCTHCSYIEMIYLYIFLRKCLVGWMTSDICSGQNAETSANFVWCSFLINIYKVLIKRHIKELKSLNLFKYIVLEIMILIWVLVGILYWITCHLPSSVNIIYFRSDKYQPR